jgi:hypothetical protein
VEYSEKQQTKDLQKLVYDRATQVQVARFITQSKDQQKIIEKMLKQLQQQEEFFNAKCEDRLENLRLQKIALQTESDDLQMKFYELKTVFNNSFEQTWNEVKDEFVQ